jgi:hypothetical protein
MSLRFVCVFFLVVVLLGRWVFGLRKCGHCDGCGIYGGYPCQWCGGRGVR